MPIPGENGIGFGEYLGARRGGGYRRFRIVCVGHCGRFGFPHPSGHRRAAEYIAQLSAGDRNPLKARLDKVRAINQNFGYGVGDDMDSLLAKYVGQ